jgi:hypothetical protein
VKRLVALFIAMAFGAGMTGSALAQGQTTPTAPKEEKKAAEKPAAETKNVASRDANGTVKSSAGESLVVTGKAKGKDAEWTFAVGPKTQIRKGGKDITVADLAAGDPVHVRYHEDAGKAVADSVMVKASGSTAKKTADAPKTEPAKAAEPAKK